MRLCSFFSKCIAPALLKNHNVLVSVKRHTVIFISLTLLKIPQKENNFARDMESFDFTGNQVPDRGAYKNETVC